MNQAAKFTGLVLVLLTLSLKLDAQTTPPPARDKSTPASSRAPNFKANVDLVQVEVGVHDGHGRAVGNLEKDNFSVFEDGKQQEISFFSHEELPLAVALVVDNSSSIAAALEELRVGALNTLGLLKPDDKVAIFSFGAKPELVEGLTSNHYELSVDLWALSPYGGTALNDAIYDAAQYLGRSAVGSRRAIILVSDNEPSDEETRGVEETVRAAQQAGTPVYSIKVGFMENHSRSFFLTHSEARLHDVEKICKQTGGVLIDTHEGTSVTQAMETIINWLKQGYTLGYYPSNRSRDGTFRSIEVRVNGLVDSRKSKYTIYAKPGYYAPTGQ